MFTAANNTEYGLYPDYDSNNFPLLSANQNSAFAATFTTGKSLDATITYSGLSGDVLTTTTTFVAERINVAAMIVEGADLTKSLLGAAIRTS